MNPPARLTRLAFLLALGLTFTACSTPQLRTVEVRVDACQTNPAAARYPAMLEAAFARVQGVRVRLAPIEALNSATVSAVVIDLPAASWSASELDQQDALREGRKKLFKTALGWQRACAASKGKRGTDLLGAIGAASQHLGGAGSTLVLLSSGFQQSPQLNLYDTRLKDLRAPLEALRKAGLTAKLQGVTVCFSGVNNGDGQVDPQLSGRVQGFWEAYFKDSGTTALRYGPDLDCPSLEG